MDRTLGIYIHIPFCASRCAYCDFYSTVGREAAMDSYAEAVCAHIREAKPQLAGYCVDTVYFGGGTPSWFGAERLAGIFETLKSCARVYVDSEVTAEMNPDSTDPQGLRLLRSAGFNRLSFGVQSANDGILKSIGRRHDFAGAERAVENAREAGFGNISLDLIYGLPSQTREDWADTIVRAAALKPEHFSCYGLTIAEGTELWPFRDSPFIPDDDTQADMYLYTVDALARYGYRQYEISNFARRGFRSEHNYKYWTGGEYMGFGAAAHSYIADKRYSNVSDIDAYIAGMGGDGSVVDMCETITTYERAGEYLMLGLRTVEGVSESAYRQIYPHSFELMGALLDKYVEDGWAEKEEDRWRLTPRGFLISNVLIGGVLEAQMRQRLREVAPYNGELMPDDSQMSLFSRLAESVSLFNGI